MNETTLQFKSFDQLSSGSRIAWRIAQVVVWLVGAAILFCLLFFPTLGVTLFWNILIPVAPLLLVLATGLWRNVCPLASTNLLPRHLGLSKRKKLSAAQQGKLNLTGVIALFAIVPLRHALLNRSGMATAVMIISAAVIATGLGLIYEWKSAWCSGLCPVHPVEKLYGGKVMMSLPNAHCSQCVNCSVPCPDSTPHINPKSSSKTIYHRLSGLLIIGGLPGFIWGWFHVADVYHAQSFYEFVSVYKMPLLGCLLSMTLYLILSKMTGPGFDRNLTNIFAAAGVSCYYWYRIPALLGFGLFGHDGMLVDLGNILPAWSISVITMAMAAFLFFWLVVRKETQVRWALRPPYGQKDGDQIGNLTA